MSSSHRSIDAAELDRRERYHLMIACVVPRPIAWTSTMSSAGITNLARSVSLEGSAATPPP